MKGDKPTLKQKKFAAVYAETGNATEAAMIVYQPEARGTARAIGSENLAKPVVQQEIRTLVESLQETAANHLSSTDAIKIAINSALKDCSDNDPKVRKMGRDSIEGFSQLFGTHSKPKETTHNHLHLIAPKRTRAA